MAYIIHLIHKKYNISNYRIHSLSISIEFLIVNLIITYYCDLLEDVSLGLKANLITIYN